MECTLDQQGTLVLGFPVDMIADARLVLTDDLIREALRRAKNSSKDAGGSEPPQEE